MTIQIHWSSWLFWGFVASLALVSAESIAQGLGLTRLNLPLILGSALTPNRDRARALGIGLHIIIGWLFSLVYVVAMQFLGGPTLDRGALVGVWQGLFIFLIGCEALPWIHSRIGTGGPGP